MKINGTFCISNTFRIGNCMLVTIRIFEISFGNTNLKVAVSVEESTKYCLSNVQGKVFFRGKWEICIIGSTIMTSDKLQSGEYSTKLWTCYKVTQSINKLQFTGWLIRLATESGKCRQFNSNRFMSSSPVSSRPSGLWKCLITVQEMKIRKLAFCGSVWGNLSANYKG